MKGYLHQIHPVLPVKNVVEALDFYVNRLGFKIAFADDSKKPTYAGIIRDGIEIHLQWHDARNGRQLLTDLCYVLLPKTLMPYLKSFPIRMSFMPIPF